MGTDPGVELQQLVVVDESSAASATEANTDDASCWSTRSAATRAASDAVEPTEG